MDIYKEEAVPFDAILNRLRAGETIVYPTETCYGLGADATNQEAVDAVFRVKQRQKSKSVLVLMADIAMAETYVYWNDRAEALAEQHWPGPLTLVLEARDPKAFATGVVGSDGTIALRVTAHPFAQALVEGLGRPLVSTSANIASLESPYDVDAIVQMYRDAPDQPDMLIDSGDLPHQAPSTIVAVTNGELHVIRQGDIVVS